MVVTEKKLTKELIKHDGHIATVAKKLGIYRQSINKRLRNNPHIVKKVLSVREAAMKRAGLKREQAYRVIAEGQKATLTHVIDGELKKTNLPDRKERRECAKLNLQLHGDLKEDGAESSITNIGTFIFQLITGQERKTIDVA